MDGATQRQLIRGAQLRELLKQAPAQPLSVVQQVAIIYTGTRTSLLGNVGDLTAFMVAGQGLLFGRMRAVEPYPEIARVINVRIAAFLLVRLNQGKPRRCPSRCQSRLVPRAA